MKKTLFSRCSRLYFFDMKFVFMRSEQAVALRIWFKQKNLSQKSQTLRVLRLKFSTGSKSKKSCLRFFETMKKSYIVPPYENKGQIRNCCPHLLEKPCVALNFDCLIIRFQSSRLSKIWKFVPLIFFYCDSIFYVIRVSNTCVYQKTLPAVFEKKRLSLSLLCLSKWSLKVENEHPVQHLAPPVLRTAGAPGLKFRW